MSNPLIKGDGYSIFEDNRNPVYNIPSWIDDPFPEAQVITGSTVRKKYNFDSIVKRFNGGNAYFGKRINDGVTVIIKEARKNILVNGNILKTKLRENEFIATQIIYDSGYRFVPEPFEKIEEPFSTFFIYEYIKFPKISTLSGVISPMLLGNARLHLKEVLDIVISLINQVEVIHKQGFENIDISNTNIACDGDKIYFIDLDSLHGKNEHSYNKTSGFWINDMKNNQNIIRDYQRIFFVFAFLFANQNMTFCKTKDQQMIFSNFWRWTLKKKLSPRFLIYIQKLLNIKSVNDMKEIKRTKRLY